MATGTVYRVLLYRVFIEVLLLASGIYIYEQCYILSGKYFSTTANHKAVAITNAYRVVAVEEALHIMWEASWQHAFLQTGSAFIRAVNFFYMTFHLPICIAFWILNLTACLKADRTSGCAASAPTAEDPDLEMSLVQIDRTSASPPGRPAASTLVPFPPPSSLDNSNPQHSVLSYAIPPDGYRIMRNAFILSHVFICGMSVLYPCAPPRMLEERGFIDTILKYTHTHLQTIEERMMINPFAAMPSLHFGYANWIGMGLLFWGRHRVWSVLGVVYQVMVLAAIVVTGNHFFLDAAVAAAFNFLALWLSFRFITPYFDPASAGARAGDTCLHWPFLADSRSE